MTALVPRLAISNRIFTGCPGVTTPSSASASIRRPYASVKAWRNKRLRAFEPGVDLVPRGVAQPEPRQLGTEVLCGDMPSRECRLDRVLPSRSQGGTGGVDRVGNLPETIDQACRRRRPRRIAPVRGATDPGRRPDRSRPSEADRGSWCRRADTSPRTIRAARAAGRSPGTCASRAPRCRSRRRCGRGAGRRRRTRPRPASCPSAARVRRGRSRSSRPCRSSTPATATGLPRSARDSASDRPAARKASRPMSAEA